MIAQIQKEAQMAQRAFPLDIWSVKEYGLNEWSERLFWPVTDVEMRALYAEVDGLLVKTANSVSREMSDGICVLFSVLAEYFVAYVNARIVLHRTGKEGLTPAFRSTTRFYPELSGNRKGLPKPDWYGRLPKQPTAYEKIRALIKNFVDAGKLHGYGPGRFLRRSDKPDYLCFHYPSPDKQAFAASRGRKIRILHPRHFMPKYVEGAVPIVPEDQKTVDGLINRLRELAMRYGVVLDARECGDLNALTLSSLRRVCDSIDQIRPMLRKLDKTSIMLDGLGNLFKRCFSMAARIEGHQVVGFTHGNTVGMGKVGTFSYVEIAVVDEYVVPTASSARFFSDLQRKFRLQESRKAEIVSTGDDSYRKMWDRERSKPLPAAVKTVMIVECAITGLADRDIYYFWPFQVDLTLRVAKSMRGKGIRTILKRHPDRLAESGSLYDAYFDEVIADRFENVYERADALYFPYISSTTFGFSLLTNKPIIFFDTMLETVWEDMHKPLRKRCRVVPSEFDGQGRLAYDEKAFLDALLKKPEKPDDEFVEKNMFA